MSYVDFFLGKKNSSSSFPAKGAPGSWYFWCHVAKPISRGYLWGVHAQSVHWKKKCWLRNQNYIYPVILKILGFQMAPHFIGKYIIPGDHYGSPNITVFCSTNGETTFPQMYAGPFPVGTYSFAVKKKQRITGHYIKQGTIFSGKIPENRPMYFSGKVWSPSIKMGPVTHDPWYFNQCFNPLSELNFVPRFWPDKH